MKSLPTARPLMKRRSMVIAAAALCCVACGQSFAQGPATATLATTAGTRGYPALTATENQVTGLMPVRASLQVEAASARYLLSDNESLFLKALDAEGSKALEPALSVPRGEAADKFWSGLMTGALQVRHQTGTTGETLWFNPIFDTGLVVEWKRGAGQWEPDAAWWVLGEDIRNSGAAKLDAKSAAAADPVALALRNGEAVFRIAGAADWHAPQASKDAQRIAAERVKAVRASLEKLEASQGGSAVVRAAGELLVLGQPSAAANGPKVKPVLAAMGPDARARMRVVSASKTGAHAWVLAMQSPDSPSLAIFITTSNVNTAPIALVDLKLLRFNKQEGSHE
jgi:hypothetical protein